MAEVHWFSRNAVAENTTTRRFLDVLTSEEVTVEPPAGASMRIVLMGKTTAGKSTLLAVLTGGSADRIGNGGQRTSLNVFAAPAVDLNDVEIVDTPGVAAYEGAEDVALAMAEIPHADLVLWVASNDSFQEKTADALRTVALRGKPVVVALNCRAALVDDLAREDFLENPASVFAEHEGHFERIRSYLSAAAVQPVAEVMLHAEAARQGRAGYDDAAELWEASRLTELLAVLREEADKRRDARRVVRETDEVRSRAHVLSEALAAVERETQETIETGRGLREDQRRRTTRLVDACEQRMADDVVRLVRQRQGWHQSVTDFGPQVNERWNTEQAALVAELDEALKTRLTELAREMEEASVAAEREWTNAVRPRLQVSGVRDFRGLWMRRAAGVVAGSGGALASMALGAYVGSLAGPLGTVTGAVVGGLGSLLVTPLRKKIQSLFTSKTKILEENRQLLRTEIGRVLDDLEDQTLAEVTGTVTQIQEAIDAFHTGCANDEAAALSIADLLAGQQEVLGSAVSALDRETVRCLLRVDGRPRLAASIGKVTRLPGVCIAVEVPDDALAEAWLFPPSSPEILTFGRPPSPGLPGASAMPYVLGLTEQVPTFTHCRPDGTIVATDVPVPSQVLEAWSATLSDHLDTPVEIVRPTAPRRTSA